MRDVTGETKKVSDNSPAERGPTLFRALIIAVTGAVIATGATIVLTRNGFGSGIDALLVAVALVAVGITAYGLMQAVLAVVDTAGERRRQDREVSERRQGDRARAPRKN